MRPNTLAPVCAGETRASMRPATRLSHARGPSSTRPIQPGGCEQCHVNPRCIVSIGAPCRTYAPAARDTNCTGRIPRQFVSSVSCPSSIIQSCRPPVSHGLTSVVLGNARTHSTHEQKPEGAISLSEPLFKFKLARDRRHVGDHIVIRSRTWTRPGPSQMEPLLESLAP